MPPLTESQIRRMVTMALGYERQTWEGGTPIDWRALCAEQNRAITRGVVYRKALYALVVAFFVAGVVAGRWM